MAANQLILFWLVNMLVTSGSALAQDEWVVNLTSMSLTSFPLNYTNATILILNNNLIEMSASDQEALGSYPNLVELHMDGNKVHALTGKLFSSLSTLKVLSLSGNSNLTLVDPDAFNNLTNLESLDLSHNGLLVLPPEVFGAMPSLLSLQLQGNRLETLCTLTVLTQLRSVDMATNPWNCSCSFVREVHRMNASGVLINGPQTFCATPAEKNILLAVANCQSSSSVSTVLTPNTAPSPTQLTTNLTLAQTKPANISKDQEPVGGDGGLPVVGHTWKFLVGVLVIALSTSALIVCAVKSPSWYKLLFNYRHQRLREEDEPHIFNTSRYSNFSLDTQQTETSAHELDDGLDDYEEEEEEEEDGYIEDRYIEMGDYKDIIVHGEP